MVGGTGGRSSAGGGIGPVAFTWLFVLPQVPAVLVLSRWGLPGVLGAMAGTVVSLVLALPVRLLTGRRPSGDRPDWSRLSQGVIWWLVLGWCAAIVAVAALLPSLVNAWSLSHPVLTTAVAAGTDVPCRRCSKRAAVLLRAQGREVVTDLRAPFQEDGYYRAGIPVVYERDDPTEAMAVPDREFGRGPVPPSGLALALLVLVPAVRRAERAARS